MDISEILRDRDKYPDDREVDWGDGVKVSLGDLRNGWMPKSDMTRLTEKASQTERDLREQLRSNQAQLADAMARAEATGRIEPEPATATSPGGYTREQILADPLLGPQQRKIDELEAKYAASMSRLEMHEKYVKTREFKGRLNLLGDKYTRRFNSDGKGKAWSEQDFLDYVGRNPLLRYDPTSNSQDVDLETMFDTYTRDDERAALIAEAESRGVEKGKRMVVPTPTFGRRRTAIQRDKSLPEDFSQVTTEQIANDPEIQEAMQQDNVA